MARSKLFTYICNLCCHIRPVVLCFFLFFFYFLVHRSSYPTSPKLKQKYTEQKKKHNNYIPLTFEQTMIQIEIIAFSTSALDVRLPNARN